MRQIISFKAKKLIEQIRYSDRKDPKLIHSKFKSLISNFEMSKDPKIYCKLLSCMIFLSKKRSYEPIIKAIAPDEKWLEYMLEEVKFLKDYNESNDDDLPKMQIFDHPILSLAKTLFYREKELQDVFFMKSLG